MIQQQTDRSVLPADLSGLFTMELHKDRPGRLQIEPDLLLQLGLPTDLTPEQVYEHWKSAIHPDDLEAVEHALSSTAVGFKEEVRYKWDHPRLGWLSVSSAGIRGSDGSGGVIISGTLKNASDSGETESPDISIFRHMLTDAMMDSYAFCALTDIENGTVFILKDTFLGSAALGKDMDFDTWFLSMKSLIAEEDYDLFAASVTRSMIKDYFSRGDNEWNSEYRFYSAKYHGYRWMKVRFVKLQKQLAHRYSEFLVFSDITDSPFSDFRESLRMRLLNGLALPYHELDLINLKTGVMYSSKSGEGKFAEDFKEYGSYDEALLRFTSDCDFNREQLDSFLGNYLSRNMKKLFASGAKRIETEVRHCYDPDDGYEWVRVQAFLAASEPDGSPYLVILTVQGVNAEKEEELLTRRITERALRTERQYKQAILSTSIAVYNYNVTQDMVYDEVIEFEGVEPMLPKLGLSVPCSYNEYIRRKSEMLTSEEEAEQFRKKFCTGALLDMFSSGSYSFDFEYELKMPLDSTGDIYTGVFRESVILIKEPDTGDIWGLTYIRNATPEREKEKRIQQALRDAFEQAQRANSAKTLFMSQMSHDIRTPLNSVLGMTSIIQEHIDDRERVLDCIEKIDNSGHHLLELINNVLDLSAIESGKTVLAQNDFDMLQFIDETVRLARPLAEKKNQSFTVDIGNINSAVIGDNIKLRQVLMNIIGNAVKYTPAGGSIKLSVKELEQQHIDVCRYMFTVEDNGIGMPAEFIPRIFDPFVRADDKRTSRIEGTGLGMPIALNIARMMNGGIVVKSEEGKGSTFEISVCLKRGTQHQTESADGLPVIVPKKVRMSDYDFGGKRVLLAEDLEFNAEIASEFLSQANIIAELASDGAQAVEMFSRSEPGYYSLIFMDIQMPELDGNEATRKIRALDRPDALTVPIIAMTANAFMEDIMTTRQAGMNGHISKPIEIPQLAAQLVKIFGDCRREKDIK